MKACGSMNTVDKVKERLHHMYRYTDKLIPHDSVKHMVAKK